MRFRLPRQRSAQKEVNYGLKKSLILYWEKNRLLLEDFETHSRISLAPIALEVLDSFRKPRTVAAAVGLFPEYSADSVSRTIKELVQHGFLLTVAKLREQALENHPVWSDAVLAAAYHFSTRDPDYFDDDLEKFRFFKKRLETSPQPPLYKLYPGAARIRLRTTSRVSTRLMQALARRRTVRAFRRDPIRFSDLSLLVRKTWGQTGWLDSGLLGRLPSKSSPSAGARHPIECYVIAWTVRGLLPGIYHYDVRDDCLERIRRGDFRRPAAELAAGMDWLENAGFICLMTAVVERTFWKYPSSGFYRLLYLDAGHLGQTFCLLATALGLGPFTSAALRHKRVETLLRINGVDEIPIYLCGAGHPLDGPTQ